MRGAVAEDSPAIAGVVKAVYEEYGFPWDAGGCQADLYDIGAHYLDLGHGVWVACQDEHIAGVVALKVFDPVPGVTGDNAEVGGRVRLAGSDASLGRLYVHRDARRHGAGTALVETALSHARAVGRRAVEIWSDKRFVEAHRLYVRFGARTVGERLIYDPDPCEEWGMQILLDR